MSFRLNFKKKIHLKRFFLIKQKFKETKKCKFFMYKFSVSAGEAIDF